MRLIINADDLGRSEAINRAIFDLMASDQISSATIMANGPAVETACGQLPRFPGKSFGVHLNLTEFSPLADDPDLGPLLDGDGAFVGVERIFSVKLGHRLRLAIFREFCRQVERLQRLGVAVSHIDSHQHILNRAGLLPVLKRLQLKFKLRKVRITRNIFKPGARKSKLLMLKKAAYNTLLRHLVGTRTTQGFTSFSDFCEAAGAGRMPYETVEAMTHPGVNPDETALLTSGRLESLPLDIQIVSYHQL